MKTRNRLLALLVTAFAAVALLLGAGRYAQALPEGEAPEHSKLLMDNGDGTYKLALTVTGDEEEESETVGGVNVVIVYDVSSSMTSNATGMSYSRADQAEAVVHDFLTNLAEYQNENRDNIYVTLVTFAVTGTGVYSGWSPDVIGHAGLFDSDGTNGVVKRSYTGNGTNWEAALSQAGNYASDPPNTNPTFVIMITDGAPTASGDGSNAVAPTTASIATLRNRYNAATGNAYAIAQATTATDGTFYGIYAYGTEADLLDDLMYFSVNNQHRGGSINNVVEATQDAPNYFNAGDTTALQAAIDEIFGTIVKALGVSDVAISDGTTSDVTTSTGDISNLLTVDEGSYKYYRAGGIEDGSEKYDSSANDGLGEEWADAPAATFEDGAVKWNLGKGVVLEDDVTYTVTFDCWPSQTTLDIVADIKNDPGEDGAWGDLDPEVQKYIDVDGNLKTNTTATLTWVDTRDGREGSSEYDNPDPVKTSAVEQLAIAKEWENEIDSQSATDVALSVTRDGDPIYSVTLNSGNGWKSSVYISVGILRTASDGSDQVLTTGHDFTFTEPSDLSYHWEIDVPTVRPMLVNGVPTMLIKVDDAHPAPDGATTHTIEGATYYEDDSETASLTATNYRRSSLDLTKVVEGSGAPEDAVFPFTVNIENSNVDNGDENDLSSDQYVWFSVKDADGNRVTDAVDSGATAEEGDTGYFYAESGSDVVINMKAGYNVRFINLPSGTTYTITEGDLEEGFEFASSELSITEGDGEDSTFEGDVTTTGTIESTNTQYTVTYTNTYTSEEPETIDVKVTKVWDDSDNADGTRPASVTVELMGNGAFTGKTAVLSADNSWTYTFTGLATEAGGKAVEYTVEEKAIDGYTAKVTGSAADGFTITNSHTTTPPTPPEPKPVEIDPPVLKIIKAPNGVKAAAANFTFQMKAVTEGAPMPEGSVDGVKTVTIKGAGSTEFGVAKIAAAGTYEYEITEVKGDAECYAYDTTAYKLAITVTADKDGNLSKEEVITGGDGKAIVFTNTYTPKTPDLPKTSDDSMPLGTIVMIALTGAVLVGAGIVVRLTRKD